MNSLFCVVPGCKYLGKPFSNKYALSKHIRHSHPSDTGQILSECRKRSHSASTTASTSINDFLPPPKPHEEVWNDAVGGDDVGGGTSGGNVDVEEGVANGVTDSSDISGCDSGGNGGDVGCSGGVGGGGECGGGTTGCAGGRDGSGSSNGNIL